MVSILRLDGATHAPHRQFESGMPVALTGGMTTPNTRITASNHSPTSDAEARALQSRLALIGQVGGSLAGLALLAASGYAVLAPEAASDAFFGWGLALCAFETFVLGLVGWRCSLRPLSAVALKRTDAALTLTTFGVVAALMHVATFTPDDPVNVALASVFALSFTRAISVPSSWQQTLGLTLSGAALLTLGTLPLAGELGAVSVVGTMGFWSALSAVIAAGASHELYGLRNQAREVLSRSARRRAGTRGPAYVSATVLPTRRQAPPTLVEAVPAGARALEDVDDDVVTVPLARPERTLPIPLLRRKPAPAIQEPRRFPRRRKLTAFDLGRAFDRLPAIAAEG